MSDPQTLPLVTVTGRRTPPSDDVSIVIGGKRLAGWTEVRITRGIERIPNDFELKLTERFPGQADAMVILPGQACEVFIGIDKVVTGYVDRVMPMISARDHSITVTGRGKCQDLLDCAAEWPGGQISGSSVLEIAKKIAAPYGIEVIGENGSTTIPQFNLMLGETAYEIIERLCRISQLLAYEDEDGVLNLATTKLDIAASGFAQGVNVLNAVAAWTQDQRFSEYQVYRFSFDPYKDIGEGGNLVATFYDKGVQRHRRRIIIIENGKDMGLENAQDRAQWEAARRFGRSGEVRLSTDAWRDRSGALYQPNTLMPIDIPALKIHDKLWTVSEVTYHKTSAGTTCDLVLMPPDAFMVQPTLPPVLIPGDIARLPPDLGKK